MPVRRKITSQSGVFFITFTCVEWQNLFEIANCYDAVYRWFDYLKQNQHYIVGYVIMPNHLHSLIAFNHTGDKSINSIIGNGKRFMAYDIVRRLSQEGRIETLNTLRSKVGFSDKKKNKIHEVFETSFDWKECWDERFLLQKLRYIHANPCKGKWNLAANYWEYPHSSAQFYTTGHQGVYEVTHYKDLRSVELTQRDRRVP